jgi:hypothetical protein
VCYRNGKGITAGESKLVLADCEIMVDNLSGPIYKWKREAGRSKLEKEKGQQKKRKQSNVGFQNKVSHEPRHVDSLYMLQKASEQILRSLPKHCSPANCLLVG